MLKDSTLGQYFPGDSFVHKLDPRTKLIFLVIEGFLRKRHCRWRASEQPPFPTHNP